MLTKNDLNQIRKVVKEEIQPVEERLSREIRGVDKKLDRAQEDISEILTAIDQHQTLLEKRVEKLEEHVGITEN